MSNDPTNRPPLSAAVERLRQAAQNFNPDGHDPQPAENNWVESSSRSLEQTVDVALRKALNQFRTEIEETHAIHRRELMHAVGSITLTPSDGERQALVKEVAGHCHNGAARATFWLLTLLFTAAAFAAGLFFFRAGC